MEQKSSAVLLRSYGKALALAFILSSTSAHAIDTLLPVGAWPAPSDQNCPSTPSLVPQGGVSFNKVTGVYSQSLNSGSQVVTVVGAGTLPNGTLVTDLKVMFGFPSSKASLTAGTPEFIRFDQSRICLDSARQAQATGRSLDIGDSVPIGMAGKAAGSGVRVDPAVLTEFKGCGLVSIRRGTSIPSRFDGGVGVGNVEGLYIPPSYCNLK
jgi:hypothetical protein